eukprot:GHVP01029762.1.p1 GENE.GHVP01029762.1~~GHVP01029762.1.p1  ORF type:complete len:643 (-),score=119.43 GHVP01029762.1:557-2485(-)
MADEISDCVGHSVWNDTKKCLNVALKNRDRGLTQDTRATVENVLDPRTMKIIDRMRIQKIYFSNFEACVSTGKEANVYKGTGGEYGEAAVKVYKTSILSFKERSQYVQGDNRFERGYHGTNPRKMVTQWAEKEFRNLKRMMLVGVRCPIPHVVKSNILVMTLLNDPENGVAPRLMNAPRLSNVTYKRLYLESILLLRLLFQRCRLVHADYSAFNILYFKNHLYVIDVSQAVDLDHPKSFEFLKRDIEIINMFFASKFNMPDSDASNLQPDKCVRKTDTRLFDEWNNVFPLKIVFDLVTSSHWEKLLNISLLENMNLNVGIEDCDQDFWLQWYRVSKSLGYDTKKGSMQFEGESRIPPEVASERNAFRSEMERLLKFAFCYWRGRNIGIFSWDLSFTSQASEDLANFQNLEIFGEVSQKEISRVAQSDAVWKSTWMPARLNEITDPVQIEKANESLRRLQEGKKVKSKDAANAVVLGQLIAMNDDPGTGKDRRLLGSIAKGNNKSHEENSDNDSECSQLSRKIHFFRRSKSVSLEIENRPQIEDCSRGYESDTELRKLRKFSPKEKKLLRLGKKLEIFYQAVLDGDEDSVKLKIRDLDLGGKIPENFDPKVWKKMVKLQSRAIREEKSDLMKNKKGRKQKNKH